VSSRTQLRQTGANAFTQGSAKPDNAILASLRSASDSIKKALTIEPKVIPAADPTSLSSQPVEVGADLYFQAAKVYQSQNNIPGAISHYQKALEKSPRDPMILVNFGRLYDGQGDLRSAEVLYQQALQAAPDNCAVLNSLGICYAKQGNLDTALSYIYRATQLQPQNTRYRNNMANVLTDAGRINEAYAQLVTVHGEAGAHYNLGYMLSHQGKKVEARRELELALQANPNMEQARTMLNSLVPAATPAPSFGANIDIPGQYTVSPPLNPAGANQGERGPQLGGRSLNQRSPNALHNLPPL
jgi:tetratricopeptide (TPR) repeat protein